MSSTFLRSVFDRPLLPAVAATVAGLALALTIHGSAQQPSVPAQQPISAAPQPADQTPADPPAAAEQPAAAPAGHEAIGEITEAQLRQELVGKTFYLRSAYLDDSLTFNEHGAYTGHSPKGSYTLSLIEVSRIRLLKHKLEIEGVRYGLHFNEQLAYEDPATAFDKVRITPKKKIVRITIDREMVVKPKKIQPAKVKPEKPGKAKPGSKPTPADAKPGAAASPTPLPEAAPEAPAPAQPTAETAANQPETAPSAPEASAAPKPESAPQPTSSEAAPANQPAASSAETAAGQQDAPEVPELSPADQLKASIAATPDAERPADPTSITTTTSPAHSAQVLEDALDSVFAPGLDDRMMSAMPNFWKLYYQAAAAKTDYRPTDPNVLRQSAVDKKARLLSSLEPGSNQYAQDNGVAGMALYHAVVGPDGKVQEIAVGRPIGFGLDENAVDVLSKAKFEPAVKDGKPVPVILDLIVQFRIYSKRTAAVAHPNPDDTPKSDKPDAPILPGPYSVQHTPQQ